MKKGWSWSGFVVLLVAVVVVLLMTFVRITSLIDSGAGYSNATIEPGQQSAYGTEMNPGDHYRVTILSASAPVDVIVLDAWGYDNYVSTLQGSLKPWTPYVTVRNVTSAEVDFTSQEANFYYLVVDNSPLVEGGADGASTVHIDSSTNYRGNEHYLLSVAGIPFMYW